MFFIADWHNVENSLGSRQVQ